MTTQLTLVSLIGYKIRWLLWVVSVWLLPKSSRRSFSCTHYYSLDWQPIIKSIHMHFIDCARIECVVWRIFLKIACIINYMHHINCQNISTPNKLIIIAYRSIRRCKHNIILSTLCILKPPCSITAEWCIIMLRNLSIDAICAACIQSYC